MQGDNISTVEGIQYSEGRILILAYLVINNDKKIIDILCILRCEFSFRSFSKIQEEFMPFESWTGVLQVQSYFEIIDNFIFRMLYLSFKFNCLCDCTRY